MSKKLWALAAAGAAYYLFKTKKGNDLRQNLMQKASDAGQKLKDQYGKYADKAKEQADNAMA